MKGRKSCAFIKIVGLMFHETMIGSKTQSLLVDECALAWMRRGLFTIFKCVVSWQELMIMNL